MNEYQKIRIHYKPNRIKFLLVAESPPPSASIQSSRHFYRTDRIRHDDRLFVNTIKALYPEAAKLTEAQIEPDKEKWLQKFKNDEFYMIESLPTSLPHEVTKEKRKELIKKHLPELIDNIKNLVDLDTKIVLIKSNPFEVAAGPLQKAGFNVLNKKLVDYPGQYNQRAYREKLAALVQN